MNKAITEGVVFNPPKFYAGLTVWSREDGTVGSATYDGAGNVTLVPADQDFGSCLEITKLETTQKIRYMGQTPLLQGCYLRVTARVKAISGNLPGVRIAGWAGTATNTNVPGVVQVGPTTTLTTYGDVVEVSAIVGIGTKGGVDMAWGPTAAYGHFGLDLTGANNGVVRIDDIEIEDITSAYLRDMMDWVDVRDFGAIGNGVFDCHDAFEAADAAANGREILVPAGTYYLGDHVTFVHAVRFEGTVTMPANKRLSLRRNYNLNSYIDAFDDETIALKKALQALFNFTDHDTLDMMGRRIELSEPIDMKTVVDNQTSFEIRRVLRNGQFNIQSSTNWNNTQVTSSGTYNIASPKTLTSVTNIANVPVGSRVSGTGVGREVYVTAVNIGAGTLTLSQPLYAPNATQTYTFTRFKYVLDFSGFAKVSQFTISDVEFLMNGFASAIMLAPTGETFHVKDCHFKKPKDRGITSLGSGCQDLQIDRCHFYSNESGVAATARTSVAFNVNANDAKIRDNRFQHFGHTGVLFGNGHLIVGNHWFQGDDVVDGPRVAGLVFTYPNVKSIITGNYLDNSFIEWTNEHDAEPGFSNEYSFGGLAITGNIFTANDVASWFRWLIIKPYGAGHFIQGLSVQGNVFKSLNGSVDRIEGIDTTFATLDLSRTRNVVFDGNSFNAVNQIVVNPVSLEFVQSTATQHWTLDTSAYLPFGGWARKVESVLAEGQITNASNAAVNTRPYITPNWGTGSGMVRLSWPEPAKGTVHVIVRMDKPV